MNESKRKILIILAVIISIVLLALLFYIGKKSSRYENKSDKKVIEIINNDAKILHYDNDIYYLNLTKFDDKYDYAISKLPINFEEDNINPEIIHKFTDVKADTNLHLYNKNIYYNYLLNTYRYNIETKITQQFCEGELQYIDNEKYVTLFNGNLYECKYFSNTYATSDIKQLTISKFVKVHEDEERIYYTSPSENGNMLLVAAKKEDFSLVVLNKVDLYDSKIESVSSTNKYVFELINKKGTYEIIRINKDTLEKTIFSLIGYNDITFHLEKNVDDIYLYAKENEDIKILVIGEKEETIEVYTGDLREDDIRNYSIHKINNYICLFKNGHELTRIENPLGEKSDIILNYVLIIEDNLYYEVSINNLRHTSDELKEGVSKVKYETILAKTSKEGGASSQINVK